MRAVFFVVVALLIGIHGEVAHRDLSSLTTKFQLLISELGGSADSATTYETEMATMLQRLEQLSTPKAQQNLSLEIDWFTGPFAQAVPMRMILVVSSFEGMYLNSGIGTFYAALADFLVNRGHTVTILYTHTAMSDVAAAAFKRWQASYEKRGIVVQKLPPSTVHLTAPTLTQKSYRVYQYLKEHAQEFDVVHFPDWEGPGYFSMLAKHLGLDFMSNVFIVGLHGPWRWVKHGNLQPLLTQMEDVETDWLERRSLELADIVITPSADLPRWLIEHGWSLSQNQHAERKLHLMPFLPGKEVAMINQKSTGEVGGRVKVSEVVFFGRMEVRKGLVLFADALDILAVTAPELSKNLKVSFLGRGSTVGMVASSRLHI
jgi:glycosyltransferase involved in cell wall biosynthesis